MLLLPRYRLSSLVEQLPDASVTMNIVSSGRGMVRIHDFAIDLQILVKADSISGIHNILAGAPFDVAGDRVAVSAANNYT